jgi:hypothetical protein
MSESLLIRQTNIYFHSQKNLELGESTQAEVRARVCVCVCVCVCVRVCRGVDTAAN